MINGYQILDIAGKGAFGQVYVAQRGQNMYAVKEIAKAQIGDDDANSMADQDFEESDTQSEKGVDKREKEIMILKYLDHPNIIKYYTNFQENDAIYIVMELHKG